MKNKIVDLNNHLFAELERLADDDLTTKENMDHEQQRAKAIIGVAEKIINIAELRMKAVVIAKEHELNKDECEILELLGAPKHPDLLK